MTGRNDPCWCGSGKKWKKCHYPKESPHQDWKTIKKQYRRQYQIDLKSPKEIEGIRAACKLTANVLDSTVQLAKAGVTTAELDRHAHELLKEAKAIPAALNYGDPPFPKAICISLNEVICHGIPDDRVLVDGDILNIDIACMWNGYCGDCSRMVIIGETSPERENVVDTAYDCLMESIKVCKPGAPLSAIGDVIQELADSRSCSVVHQFVAHGVGLAMHEAPQIPHYKNNLHIPMAPGMTFTIEPMINGGVAEGEIDPMDGWTARTLDGKPSAQWEHTIVITEDGCEILTIPDSGLPARR